MTHAIDKLHMDFVEDESCKNGGSFNTAFVARKLERKDHDVAIFGPMAIAIMKRMSIWEDFLNEFHTRVMVREQGRYSNGEPILYVNMGGYRPLFTKTFGGVRFSSY